MHARTHDLPMLRSHLIAIPPRIRVHNISPSLDEQLILEMEVRKGFLKSFALFPRGLRSRHAGPLNEDVLASSPLAGAEHAFLWRGGRAGVPDDGISLKGLSRPT
jgi:hypothetical protein